MLSLQKYQFFSLFSPPNILFEISVISVAELFLKEGGGGNSLKQTYVEGEVHVKRTGTNKGGGGRLKTRSFERTYFLNDPFMTDLFYGTKILLKI